MASLVAVVPSYKRYPPPLQKGAIVEAVFEALRILCAVSLRGILDVEPLPLRYEDDPLVARGRVIQVGSTPTILLRSLEPLASLLEA